jgi:predicted RND superfamily exporter protein
MMHHGMPRLEAVVEAGRKRARPIIMTSIAMSAGMLPSALGVGEGGSFRAPMAIAVIGGIIVSTVLSLVVVPSFFLIMDDLSRLLAWLFGRLVGKKDVDDEVLTKEKLATAVNENRKTLTALEERLDAMEVKDARQRGAPAKTNILKLPPFAAE